MNESSADRCTPVQLRLEGARRAGCQLVSLDPQTGFVHELRRGGRARVLVGGVSPLNDAAAARLASDKFHTSTVLAAAGFATPRGVRCLRPGRFRGFADHTGLGTAEQLAAEVGFPLLVKPNMGSRGRRVVMVDDVATLHEAIEAVWTDDYLALVQVPIPGEDLRLDLLDGRPIFAYRRRPLTLCGDGLRPIHALLGAADPRLTRDWCESMLPDEPQWQRVVQEQNLGLDTVLPVGHPLGFDPVILNLNRLCIQQIVDPVPADWVEIGRAVAQRMALRHLGIDFKLRSPDQPPQAAVIIEVNASPSLANMALAGHYERVVEVERTIIEAVMADAPPEGPRSQEA